MKTTNTYKLSQWEKTDRILMSDFNADNAKLETALSALAGTQTSEVQRLDTSIAAAKSELSAALAAAKAELAAESARLDGAKLQWTEVLNETFGGGEAKHEFNLAPLNLPDCWLFLMEFKTPGGTLLNYEGVSIDGSTSRLFQERSDGFPMRILFFPMKNPSAMANGLTLYNGSQLCFMAQEYSFISKLRVSPDEAGKKITGTGWVKVFVMK